MKLYLRELPNPLVPYEMYDKFVFVSSKIFRKNANSHQFSEESKDNQLTHTTELFRELPKNNQDTLAYLFSVSRSHHRTLIAFSLLKRFPKENP